MLLSMETAIHCLDSCFWVGNELGGQSVWSPLITPSWSGSFWTASGVVHYSPSHYSHKVSLKIFPSWGIMKCDRRLLRSVCFSHHDHLVLVLHGFFTIFWMPNDYCSSVCLMQLHIPVTILQCISAQPKKDEEHIINLSYIYHQKANQGYLLTLLACLPYLSPCILNI